MRLDVFSTEELENLDRIQENLTGKIPQMLADIGVYVVSSVVENFETGGRPDKWAKLADSTLARKKGTLKLIDSGLLRAGIMSWTDGDYVYVGPSGPAKPYARIQDRGGETGRNEKTIIPARPYLLLQEEDKTYIRNFIREAILGKS